MRDRRSIRKAAGFTLAECMVASVVLAMVVLAITQSVVSGQMHTYAALHAERGTALAEALMEEIIALPYSDPDGASTPGPEGGETSRSAFDNRDDFHGYTDSAGALTDSEGVAYPASYQVFSRSVSASYVAQATGLGANQNGLNVTVTVTDTDGQTWTLTRFMPEPSS